jgi:type I restriction enzyme M protein
VATDPALNALTDRIFAPIRPPRAYRPGAVATLLPIDSFVTRYDLPQQKKTQQPPASTAATIGYESHLWQMADALRGSMDAAEYKHVTLGLLFLKYISDAFEEQHARLLLEEAQGADPEDPDEYRALNIFWVPPEARWPHLKAQARQPTIGQLVDDAMAGIERDNPLLKGVLPKDYARPALDKQRLGQLIDLISNIRVGDQESRSKDVLGRVYEYFLSQFASAEGKKGGEFYTPRCVVKTLVEMLEPYKGRVYDPCCGSAGMFVQSVEFVDAHASGNGNGGRAKGDISIYGQESNYTTWRLAKMNLAIRGIEGQIAHGDTFANDRFPDLKADYILANPPFNISDWGGERLREDKRWQYGVPPVGNANFAWVQHIVHHLSPTGVAGFVLANGSMSSNQSGEGEIRKNLVEADIVDCMVALPGQLFYSTQIPACLWFLARDRKGDGFRDRRGQVLFIDARKLGRMIDRTHRELTDEDVTRIATTYHAWRGEKEAGEYEDIPGFCRSATIEEIRQHGHVLTPGRYVGAEARQEDAEPFAEKMSRLAATLRRQQAEGAKLDEMISANLKELGYGE